MKPAATTGTDDDVGRLEREIERLQKTGALATEATASATKLAKASEALAHPYSSVVMLRAARTWTDVPIGNLAEAFEADVRFDGTASKDLVRAWLGNIAEFFRSFDALTDRTAMAFRAMPERTERDWEQVAATIAGLRAQFLDACNKGIFSKIEMRVRDDEDWAELVPRLSDLVADPRSILAWSSAPLRDDGIDRRD